MPRFALIGATWSVAATSLAIAMFIAGSRFRTGWSDAGLLFVVLAVAYAYACVVSAIRAQRIRRLDATRWARAVEPTREILWSGLLLSAIWLWAEQAKGDAAALLGDLTAGGASVIGIGSVLLVEGPGRLAQREAEGRRPRYSRSAASPALYLLATPRSTLIGLGTLVVLDLFAVALFTRGFRMSSSDGPVEIPNVLALVMFFSWAAAFGVILCLGLVFVLSVPVDQFEPVEVLPRQFFILNTAMLILCLGVLWLEPRAFQEVIQGARLSFAVVGGVMMFALIGGHSTALSNARHKAR